MTDQHPQVDQLRAQAAQLKQEWEAALPVLEQSPSVYQPYLTTASLPQVTEVVNSIVYWLDRARAPRGFAPTFHLARSLAGTSLAGGITAVQAIKRGEYGFFANLLVSLNQMVSALHSMMIFGERTHTREAIAGLGGRLAESLALIETAQSELGAKVTALSRVEALAEGIVAAAEQVPTRLALIQDHLNEITAIQTDAKSHLDSVDAMASSMEATAAEAKILLATNKATQEVLERQQATLEALLGETSKQKELITALLPSAASAGLASSFAQRVREVETIKWVWIVAFVVALTGLAILGTVIHIAVADLSAQQVSAYLLRRLPIAGPLIWLGWFSAVQYGNTMRVQEDYAFKEATSKAFEGYRDHLEHLASVSLSEGNTAMTLLAARTIEVLSHEPMRVFGKAYKDASPTSSLVELLTLKSVGRE